MAAPKVERFSSALIPLPAENVDTDQIVPARYLKVVVKSGLADALFHDWRFNEDGSKKSPPFVLDDPRFAGRGIHELCVQRSIHNDRQDAVLQGVVLEDVGEARGDDRLDAEGVERPRRMLTA